MIATYSIIGINFLVFLLIRAGIIDPRKMTLSSRDVLEKKQYYRLVTSGFSHQAFYHICANMLSLYNIGRVFEYLFGTQMFAVIYMSCLILGALMTCLLRRRKNPSLNSLGASIAICGLVGLEMGLLLISGGISALISAGAFYTLLSLVIVSVMPGIDGLGHLCGFVIGAGTAFMLQSYLPPV